mmetsp:Transcript_84265/g.148949  ORF Transcript_84265/g.148949 Transcript_84265/m.148949 type:complete len:80 (+) Transcript_84265:101-340(+)|eukprot:CAMPEP_0197635436 /NCGR_PEP_ID=MMETSP1338-20131121/11259_1 /TAXON_ID=43686 ORGANISM="Pelagodinium beii, Strain RCC1491" /NCGR_SAMPLE_ID=MMETSP1338 /ASSEMBLY_ACC=CAM_ASM_000754 /LENGTH=79 /DNA_ID=CAMNT_0043207483 /DNA_START=65 /DNA_END=304 /DNA_ORIENTATION=+
MAEEKDKLIGPSPPPPKPKAAPKASGGQVVQMASEDPKVECARACAAFSLIFGVAGCFYYFMLQLPKLMDPYFEGNSEL